MGFPLAIWTWEKTCEAFVPFDEVLPYMVVLEPWEGLSGWASLLIISEFGDSVATAVSSRTQLITTPKNKPLPKRFNPNSKLCYKTMHYTLESRLCLKSVQWTLQNWLRMQLRAYYRIHTGRGSDKSNGYGFQLLILSCVCRCPADIPMPKGKALLNSSMNH